MSASNVAMFKWNNLKLFIKNNDIKLDKTDWNIFFSLVSECKTKPINVIKWLNKLENKYLINREDPKEFPIHTACFSPNGQDIDPQIRASK